MRLVWKVYLGVMLVLWLLVATIILNSNIRPAVAILSVNSWNIVASYPADSYSVDAVSCITTSILCVSVGNEQISNATQPMNAVVAVSTDGGISWTQGTLPSGISSLDGMSCASTSFCLAVGQNSGNNGVVAVSTDGGISWTQGTLPSGISSLDGVSCVSTSFCVITGATTGNMPAVLISTTGGTSWTQETLPSGITMLNGVSCSSTALCELVGGFVLNIGYTASGVMAFSSNAGLSWSLATLPPNQPNLSSVSCYSNTFCNAVGANTILKSTDGSTWSQISVPTGTFNLSSVFCGSDTFCTAVGGNADLFTDNGSTWNIGSFPSGAFVINGVSCLSTTSCVAVGENTVGNIAYSMATLNGSSTWSSYPMLLSVEVLNSVNCVTTSFCVSVGQNNSGTATAVTSTNGGSTWTTGTVPTGVTVLNSVNCVTTSFCVSVGQNNSGTATAVTSTNGGSNWTTGTVPTGVTVLNSVNCVTTSFCVSVGQNNSTSPGSYILLTVPIISYVTPNSGLTTGGTNVTIVGLNLFSTVSVSFGSIPASSFTVISNDEIIAVSPGVAATGVVNIIVTTTSANTPVNSADEFNYINPGYFHSISPVRICDTRAINIPYVTSNECNSSGPETLGSGSVLNIPIVGQASIPSNAIAVVANVTVTNTTANGGYLTLFPGLESAVPNSSNLNWNSGQTVANLVTVPIGPNGAIQAYNFMGQADVIIDLAGYYGPNSTSGLTLGEYFPVTPFRICDTRQIGTGVAQNQCNNSSTNSPIGPNQSISVQFGGNGVIPSSGVSAVAINITAIVPTTAGGGYLTAFPSGSTQPNVSNVNFGQDQTIANRAIVQLSSTGSISIYNYNGDTNIAVDVVGYYMEGTTSNVGSLFVPINPDRICDTRAINNPTVQSNQCNLNGPQTLISAGELMVQVSGVGPIPTNIVAAEANVTVTNTDANGGFLTIFPTGNSVPNISDLNWSSGVTIANNCIITLSSAGSFTAYNFIGTADVIVDVSGYFITA